MFVGDDIRPSFDDFHYTVHIQGKGREQKMAFSRAENSDRKNDNINQTITNLYMEMRDHPPTAKTAESIKQFLDNNINHTQVDAEHKAIYDSVARTLRELTGQPPVKHKQ